jgi:anti-sigma B factor antagonist
MLLRSGCITAAGDVTADRGKGGLHMTAKLKFSVSEFPDRVLVAVTGEIGVTAEDQFREALTSALSQETPCLVVDLAGVPFMASAGVGVLMGIRAVLAARDASLVLCSLSPAVARVLEVTGAADLIPVAADPKDAATDCEPEQAQPAG